MAFETSKCLTSTRPCLLFLLRQFFQLGIEYSHKPHGPFSFKSPQRATSQGGNKGHKGLQDQGVRAGRAEEEDGGPTEGTRDTDSLARKYWGRVGLRKFRWGNLRRHLMLTSLVAVLHLQRARVLGRIRTDGFQGLGPS